MCFTKLIESNTTVPTKKSEVFSTAADNQPSVEVHILQGERSMARDNKSIGRFHLDGIASAPRGVPQIEVSFDLDASGILNVSAKDKGTGKEQHIRIEASSGLTEEEITRMKKEAEAHAKADKELKEVAEKINQADAMAFQYEKQLKEQGEKWPVAVREPLEAAIKDLKEAVLAKDIARIDTQMQNLTRLFTEAAKHQSEAASNPQAEPQQDKGISDTEYEEVEENPEEKTKK